MPSGRCNALARSHFGNLVVIAGAFRPNGNAAAMAEVVGDGFTVARTGVGVFAVTTERAFTRIKSAVFSLGSGSLLGLLRKATHGSIDGTTGLATVSVTFLEWVPGTPTFTAADIAADANNWIEFVLTLDDTDITL